MTALWRFATADGWHLLCLTCAVGIPIATALAALAIDRKLQRGDW